MTETPTSEVRTPHEIDQDLAEFVYGERREELSHLFSRSAGSPERADALLGETFAKAALLRQKREDRDADDSEWIDSIAHFELSQFLRSGTPSIKAVTALNMLTPKVAVETADTERVLVAA